MSVTIVGYTPRYAKAFAQLNYQWIEHYFAVEPEDRLALDNPYDCLLYTSPSPRDS